MLGSAPYSRAVSGINCIRPMAPFEEIASQLKFDSAATILFTNAAGTPCFLAAPRMRAWVSTGAANFGSAAEGRAGSTLKGVEKPRPGTVKLMLGNKKGS